MPWLFRGSLLLGSLVGVAIVLGGNATEAGSTFLRRDDKLPISEQTLTVYDPDPNHLWNRLYQALLALSKGEGVGDADQLDPFIGHQNRDRVQEEKLRVELAKRVASLLDEFIAKKSAKLVHEPRKRAMMQRDLWAWFDGLELPRSLSLAQQQSESLNLARKVAKILPQLALSTEEIEALPNNFAEAVAANSFPDWMKADQLWDGNGPWVLVGAEDQTPLARTHFHFFGGRSAFLVLLRYPEGRALTMKHLALLRPHGSSSKIPEGAYFALARRMQLIDQRGLIVTTPLVESLEVRGLGQQVFKLNRKEFLAGKPSLLPLGPTDTERTFLTLLGRNAANGQARVLGSCGSCHTPDTMESYARFFSLPPSHRPGVIASDLATELGLARHRKLASYEWGLLQGLGHSGL